MESGSNASEADPPAAEEKEQQQRPATQLDDQDAVEAKSSEEVKTEAANVVDIGKDEVKAEETPTEGADKLADNPEDGESTGEKWTPETKDESDSGKGQVESEETDQADSAAEVQTDPPSVEDISLDLDDLAGREGGEGDIGCDDNLEPLPSPSSAAGNSSLLRRLKESPPVTLSSNMATGLRRPAVASAVVKPIPPFDTLSPELTSILEGVKVIPSGVGIEESEEEAIDKAKVLAIRVKEACQTVPALTEMMQILHGKSLESETFAFQAAYLFGCLSQLEVDQVKCRNIFLRKIQADFGRRAEIRSANYSHYLNLVTLLCQVFRRVRVADGTTIGALSEPILTCFQDLLDEPNDAGLIVFSKQVQIVCLELGRIQPEKMDELFVKVRVILTEPQGLTSRCLASILMVLELYLAKWRPMATEAPPSSFYARHIPPDARFSPMQVSRISGCSDVHGGRPTPGLGATAAAEQLLMAGLTLNETPLNLPDVSVPPPNMMPPRHRPPPHMMMQQLPPGPPRGQYPPPIPRGGQQMPPHHGMGGFDMRGRRSLRASKSMIDRPVVVDEWAGGGGGGGGRMRPVSPQIDEWQVPPSGGGAVGGSSGHRGMTMNTSRMGVSRTNSDTFMGRGGGRDHSESPFWSAGGSEVSVSKWSTNDDNIPGSSTWSTGAPNPTAPGSGGAGWGMPESTSRGLPGGSGWSDFPGPNCNNDIGSNRGGGQSSGGGNGGWGDPPSSSSNVWGSAPQRNSPVEPKTSGGWGDLNPSPSGMAGGGGDTWGTSSDAAARGSSGNGWASGENKTPGGSGWGSNATSAVGMGSSWGPTDDALRETSSTWGGSGATAASTSGPSTSTWGAGENVSNGDALGSWGSSKLVGQGPVVPQVSNKSWNLDDDDDDSNDAPGVPSGLSGGGSGGWGAGNVGSSGTGWG